MLLEDDRQEEVYVGLRSIPVPLPHGYASTMVSLSYVREGDTIEWLEGWVNPTIMNQLDITDRYFLITQAQTKLRNIIRKVVGRG